MITLVTQTTPTNCVSACIAMIMDKPIDKVTAEFDQRYKSDFEISELDYFRENDIDCEACFSTQRQLFKGFVYTLAVPSLNIDGGLHSIVCYCPHEGEPQLFDPNKGREERKHYVLADAQDPMTVKLSSYVPVVAIREMELKDWRTQE